jgi:hypothetical protein
MSLMACKEDTPAVVEDELRRAVGECCLMASDIINQLEPNDPIGKGPEEANKWMTGFAISRLEGKDGVEILARAQCFWFDLPADPTVRKRFEEKGVKNFEAAFAEKYGLPLRDFFLILFAVYIGFQPDEERNTNPLLLNEETLQLPKFGRENVRRVLSLVSQTPDALALKLLGTPRQNWWIDVTPLRECPVVEVFDGRHVCPDLCLLYRCLTDKVHFLLQKAYPESVFQELFGYIFESYINGLFQRFTVESDVVFRTFYAAPKFQGTNEQASDGIVLCGNTALVMEYKSRLLTTRQKYVGEQEVRLAGVEDIIGKEGNKKGLYQLANNIKQMLTGKKVVAGSPKALDLQNCHRIHPVLVTYEESVGLESIRQLANAKFTAALKREDIRSDRVGTLLILTIKELEILERLALHHQVESIVREYVDYVTAHPKDRAGSFRSFVSNKGYNDRPSGGKSMVEETYCRAMREFGGELTRRVEAASILPE